MQRLSEGICKRPPSSDTDTDASSNFPMVLAVSEDWDKGGAGNGLGTLYAYEKACRVAQEKFGVDLKSKLDNKEVSAALFHTAGKGTRLAPLPASENNNKPGVVSTDLICTDCIVLYCIDCLLYFVILKEREDNESWH